MKTRMNKMFGGRTRKSLTSGNNLAIQGATAAAVVGGAGLAGFYAWQAAAKKKSRGFMKFGRTSSGSRFNPFSR